MLSTTLLQTVLVLAGVSSVTASPLDLSLEHYEVLAMRASTTVDPNAVTNVECTDANVNIVFHDQNVAELGICGGIAGSITKCGGAPESTTGESGTALFTLNAATSGATINISKGRWEGCIRAARAVCPTGSISGTCVGGASTGNVDFTLDNP
ncbi:hypothetical protein PFICI_09303 [Pestalotiopsis fici W106-1]|uniref:Uncharacterized protein n=1 Tax=Pestalotiopsis fici (strain W106-1 / CGMCC3.15140) TaxID=1229662 RepID=W3X023_PESFW|nr:uncharacterized protein PFICI_09303 [Pestalotiopsis fici W106-1]ETS79450.1 hypothetical protein PFICI_09303 [Pestalotiopsis fici W106-1]